MSNNPTHLMIDVGMLDLPPDLITIKLHFALLSPYIYKIQWQQNNIAYLFQPLIFSMKHQENY